MHVKTQRDTMQQKAYEANTNVLGCGWLGKTEGIAGPGLPQVKEGEPPLTLPYIFK